MSAIRFLVPGEKLLDRYADAAANLDQRPPTPDKFFAVDIKGGQGRAAGGLHKYPGSIRQFQASIDGLAIRDGQTQDIGVARAFERGFGNSLRAERCGDGCDSIERHSLVRLEAGMERCGTFGLDGDDREIPETMSFQSLQYAKQKAAAANARYDAVELVPGRQDFVDERRMTTPEQRVIEGMEIGPLILPGERSRTQVCLIEVRAEHGDFGSRLFDRLPRLLGGCSGNNDRHGHAASPAAIGGGESCVTAGRTDDAARTVRDRMREPCSDAAELETSGGLQRVQLEHRSVKSSPAPGVARYGRGFDVEGRSKFQGEPPV